MERRHLASKGFPVAREMRALQIIPPQTGAKRKSPGNEQASEAAEGIWLSAKSGSPSPCSNLVTFFFPDLA